MKNRALTQNIAKEISFLILSGTIGTGTHLSAQQLADKFGVSRSPIREALIMLTDQGILEQKPNRGFFTRKREFSERSKMVSDVIQTGGDVKIYDRIVDDWLQDRIPGEVTEQQLRERYKVTKSQLHSILVRAVREGWAEQKPGYGWRFLEVAKTPEAFEQIYRFRMLIEPAAMFEPGFSINRRVLDKLRRDLEKLLSLNIDQLPEEYLRDYGAMYILESGLRFHEELIKLSGNPFFYTSLVRVNRMRRLLEYRRRINRERYTGQDEHRQHLEIISLLEKGDILEASSLLRQHLRGALLSKSSAYWSETKE